MPSHHISSKLQKKWHFSSKFHSQFAHDVDFKNDTRLSLHQQIMASTCNQNPNLTIFFHGAKLLKGQRSFSPRGKGRVGFCQQKFNNFKPPPASTAWWKLTCGKISSHKLFEAQNNHFCKKQKKWDLFGKAPKKNPKKKGEPFWFGFLCTCKRGPKVRRTAAQYLESHKQTIWDVIADQGKFSHVLFFSNNDSKIGIWDILTKREYPT